MNGIQIFVFIFIMWLMIIGGGGLLLTVIAPISINGSEFDHFLDSGIKALIAILLVIAWIFIMSKIKNWIFQKQIKH